MLDIGNPILWFIGVIAFAAAFFLVRGRFGVEAKARRRRERSNRPLISKRPGPTVRFAANVDKPKRNRKA
jgi:hypothetical protein